MGALAHGSLAREGNPLSPYLFLLVAETLQQLIKSHQGTIRHPIEDSLPCPVLQYADDTLIVVRGEPNDVANLKQLLDMFADANGLKINYNKSTAVPIHMNEAQIQQCISTLACKRDSFVPISKHKLPVSTFSTFIHKTDRYLAGWQASLLNLMGRRVLVNLVLNS
jgi:hypothetical protein